MSGLNFCLFLERVAMHYHMAFKSSGTGADLIDSISCKSPELAGGR